MSRSMLKIFAALPMALFLSLLVTSTADAADCGGLNQKSCWNVNPAKWCHDGLKYVPGGLPGKGRCVKPTPKPKPKDCGGLNQKSCWNADPKKWCNSGLKYVTDGLPGSGRCIKPSDDPTPGCGGLNEKSCWSADPRKWCDGDLKYAGTGIPGQGHCIKKVTDSDLKRVANDAFHKIDALGSNNPLMNLRNCLKQPGNFAELKKQMGKKSENGINAILGRCNA